MTSQSSASHSQACGTEKASKNSFIPYSDSRNGFGSLVKFSSAILDMLRRKAKGVVASVRTSCLAVIDFASLSHDDDKIRSFCTALIFQDELRRESEKMSSCSTELKVGW